MVKPIEDSEEAEPAILLMPLLNEGTSVWRPVDAVRVGKDRYRITAAIPKDEQWAFGTGAIVQAEPKTLADGTCGLVAIKL